MKHTRITDTPQHVSQTVTIRGWVHTARRMGKMVFADIRDITGVVQVVFLAADKELLEQAKSLRGEYVVAVTGLVNKRPEKLVNKDLPTGTIELQAQGLTILSTAKTTPFEIGETAKEEPSEELRYTYRYLDLRRQKNQQKIIKRSQAIKFMRDYLHGHDFYEIETPILAKSTPEGARDYLVPSRQHQGKFYALPQSPQQYKQMLMVAGFERYFQIAPCFRDEDARADRAPDQFYQLDIELSFANQADILVLTENLFTSLVKKIFPEKKISASPWPRLTYQEAMDTYGTDRPDLRQDKDNPDELAFCFVVDWPLFEPEKENGHLAPAHHMFTSPKDEDIAKLNTNPHAVRSWQHDMVLNGFEVGGGSIRITDPDIQRNIFRLIGIPDQEAQQQFGYMLEAFSYGVPPHGGIAPGIDRLFMVLFNEANVREVVAFPKTGDNREPMTGSPSAVSTAQLNELHISLQDKK